MATKHTPGPWASYKLNGRIIFHSDESDEIATISPCLSWDTHEANARLIVAAPELLAALQKAVRFGGLFPELKAEAEAAIAKATNQ